MWKPVVPKEREEHLVHPSDIRNIIKGRIDELNEHFESNGGPQFNEAKIFYLQEELKILYWAVGRILDRMERS